MDANPIKAQAELVALLPEPTVVLTASGQICCANGAFERLLGLAPSQALGRNLLDWSPGEGAQAELRRFLSRCAQTQGLLSLPLVLKSSTGATVEACGEAGRFSEDDSGPLLLLRLNSLEQQVQARTARLRETIRSLDHFCYTLAHDLRAPLRAMIGFSAELLEAYAPSLDEFGRDSLCRIRDSAARLEELIVDLLEFGRLDVAEMPLIPVNLEEALHKTLALLDSEIQEKGATVQMQMPLSPVLASSVALSQVLANLLSNALKFSRPGIPPEITIATEVHGERVRLSVRDNGIGIKAKHLHKLFQPFARLVVADAFPGTGIGLAIVRKAVERMGGCVGVESEYERGSCFWIELPPAELPSTPTSGATRAASGVLTPYRSPESMIKQRRSNQRRQTV